MRSGPPYIGQIWALGLAIGANHWASPCVVPLELPVGTRLSQPKVAPSLGLDRPLGESRSILGLCPYWDKIRTTHSPGSHGPWVASSSQSSPKHFCGLGLHLDSSKSFSILLLVSPWGSYFTFSTCSTILVESTFHALIAPIPSWLVLFIFELNVFFVLYASHRSHLNCL